MIQTSKRFDRQSLLTYLKEVLHEELLHRASAYACKQTTGVVCVVAPCMPVVSCGSGNYITTIYICTVHAKPTLEPRAFYA